ncbi:MAG TPA: hypothetical protein VFB60_23815 [Ktedonobacteraceae bacterium]|nr:hypothetical protein [Ktedonobacteraceae bacterium]
MIIEGEHFKLILDNPAFAEGFKQGQELYAEGCRIVPEYATTLSVSVVLPFVAIQQDDGRYQFDYEGAEHADTYLGIFVGFLLGPCRFQVVEKE